MRVSTLLPAAVFFEMSIAGYVLQDDYMTDFFGNFDFWTGPDPTEGTYQACCIDLAVLIVARLCGLCRRSNRETDQPHQQQFYLCHTMGGRYSEQGTPW